MESSNSQPMAKEQLFLLFPSHGLGEDSMGYFPSRQRSFFRLMFSFVARRERNENMKRKSIEKENNTLENNSPGLKPTLQTPHERKVILFRREAFV